MKPQQIVTVLSLAQFTNKIDDLINDTDAYFISVLNPDNTSKIKPDSENYKTWWFWDLDYNVGSNLTITDEQADEIADFIIQNKDKGKLYVHCSAGVARSGAIGEVVNDFFGLSYNTFKQINPQVVPNTTVKIKLHQALIKKLYGEQSTSYEKN